MKKYIILFLLWGIFGNAQYNLFARQNFAKSVSAPTFNTYIGGVSGTIATASALATKLGISVGAISNFTVVGSDIKCKITGSYAIPSAAFNGTVGTPCTYYKDTDFLVTSLGSEAFYYTNISGIIDFENVTSVNNAFNGTPLLTEILLKNCTSVGDSGFAESSNGTRRLMACYIPNVTSLGTTSGNNNVFLGNCVGLKVYAHPSLATNNSGAPDGDLAYVTSNGGSISYVTNFTTPNPVVDLSIGNVYATALQLNFTTPTGSANAISYYEVWVNGTYSYQNVTASGQYLTGLTPSTSYSIEVKPVDIFYNKSISNVVSTSTVAIITSDSDANAFIAATGISANIEKDAIYILTSQLKSNSLWGGWKTIYPFVGGTAATNKYNLKDPRDLDAAFRLLFSGTWTHNSLGSKPTSAYANTYLIPSVDSNLNNNSICFYFQNNVLTLDIYGARSSGTASLRWILKENTSGRSYPDFNGDSNRLDQNVVSDARGFFVASRTSSTSLKVYRNGSQMGSTRTNINTGTQPTIVNYLGALNNGGSAVNNSANTYSFAADGLSLTDAQVATMNEIVQLFQQVLGRKTM